MASARIRPAAAEAAAAAAARGAGEAGEVQQGRAPAAHAGFSKQNATTGSRGQSAAADNPKRVASSRQGPASPPSPTEGKQPAAAAERAARGKYKPTGAAVGHGESLKRKAPAASSNEPQAAAAEQTGAAASGQQSGADVAAQHQRPVCGKAGQPGSRAEPIEHECEEPRPSHSTQKRPRLDGPQQQQARQPDSGGMGGAGAGTLPAAEAAAAGRRDVSTAVAGAVGPPAVEAAAAGTGGHAKPALPSTHSRDQQGKASGETYKQTSPEQRLAEHRPLLAATGDWGAHPQQSGAGRGGTASAPVRPASAPASSSQERKVVAGPADPRIVKRVTEVNRTFSHGLHLQGVAAML